MTENEIMREFYEKVLFYALQWVDKAGNGLEFLDSFFSEKKEDNKFSYLNFRTFSRKIQFSLNLRLLNCLLNKKPVFHRNVGVGACWFCDFWSETYFFYIILSKIVRLYDLGT